MSSEVAKMGFFTATFLPNKVASYTTLSAPIITILYTLDTQYNHIQSTQI